ncbi:hypothetical protein [Burkholderia cenocepacia]|uniref:Uncharacterized protein n=2 Tax=Burkholderia cenocepacia TaxID=95486 RepID=A0A1V2W328_9BURK|nr:hypothetical protein [Burkholderia cenocepacia]MBR8248702.1 hypothetical protein [Burkholderia cenocepacia]MBR8288876.1 hypothetical protein [Burkholderia cenocepacia]MBR8498704.1 hypothetical protein [Burkholderia cenocepacia]ONJ13712.1 hypothetical protein A8D83_12150 [Burkholderia cenocepacia]ONJ30183.1 hypothetical protein A8D90_07060 [Burkholderia cenocepacia]
MADSTTNIDQISSTQANKELTMNSLTDAASPAMLWGRRASGSIGMTWAYYGGRFVDSTGTAHAIANGSITLGASTTTYIYADNVTGAVSSNTTAFPAGKVPLYSVVTGASSVTSWLDYRSYQPSAVSGGGGTVTSVGLSMPSGFSVANTPVTGSGTLGVTLNAQNPGVALIGPVSGAAAAPTFRALVGTDLPTFVASGSSHASGAVPDPGSTAGSTKFLREDATWAVPPGSGGGGGTVTDVGASGGIETTLASNADITSAGGLRSNLIPNVVTGAHTFVTGDRGTALITNASTAVTQTLPTPTGTSGNYPNGWWCELGSIGTGTTTAAIPSGLTLDGVTNGTLALTQFTCVKVFTDGTNWFTARGLGSGGGGTSKDAHGYYLANNPTTTGFTLSQSTSLAGNASMNNLASGRGFNIIVPCQSSADNNAFVNKAVPGGSNWTMTAMLVPMVPPGNASNYSLAVQDASGKIVLFGFDGFAVKVTYGKWASINSFSNRASYSAFPLPPGVPVWMKLTYASGGNFTFSLSSDGETFAQMFAVSVTDYISTPSVCGIWVDHNLAASNTTTQIAVAVMSYAQG